MNRTTWLSSTITEPEVESRNSLFYIVITSPTNEWPLIFSRLWCQLKSSTWNVVICHRSDAVSEQINWKLISIIYWVRKDICFSYYLIKVAWSANIHPLILFQLLYDIDKKKLKVNLYHQIYMFIGFVYIGVFIYLLLLNAKYALDCLLSDRYENGIT
jgi:hypothetical protein